MAAIEPKNDWLLVELEPIKEFSRGLIIRTAPEPIRTAKVIAVGKGKHYPDRFVPTVVKPGERIAFFYAIAETKQGRQVGYLLPEGQELIRETDVLGVLGDGVQIEAP